MVDNSKDSRWVELTHEPLDVQAAYEFLRSPGAGAIVVFAGTTRQWTRGRETVHLEYESYEAMALKVMEELLDAAALNWPIHKACLIHRLGVVPITEASVLVGVSTAHRQDAYEASRHLIDTLKVQIPIWKREHWADGGSEWITGTQAPAQGDL